MKGAAVAVRPSTGDRAVAAEDAIGTILFLPSAARKLLQEH